MPAFGSFDLMRPGFGRKRFSSSPLIDASEAVTAENRPVFG
ncbi:hypothetical protein L286_17465 [Sphingobium sp. HDIP04]|nr:hypothetical protein L286_17465 [Sphingobium sp. HDIP04]